MARLFITPKEINFISDLTKEITKDVIGQVIYYYKIREDISETHDIYEESLEKIFDPPIELDSRLQWNPQEIKTDRFGYEGLSTIEAYIHFRDMIDKNMKLQEGDYFSFGETFFEITSIKFDKIIFGQVEHVTGYTLFGKQARKGQINPPEILGPTSEIFTESDAVKKSWTQQRGQASNENGLTNDHRELIANGTLEKPITGAKSIKKASSGESTSSFYGDE